MNQALKLVASSEGQESRVNEVSSESFWNNNSLLQQELLKQQLLRQQLKRMKQTASSNRLRNNIIATR